MKKRKKKTEKRKKKRKRDYVNRSNVTNLVKCLIIIFDIAEKFAK